MTLVSTTPRSSRDGGVIDSSMSSSNSSNEEPDDDDLGPPHEDEGDGHTNDKLRRPRMRSDLFSQPMPSDSQPMPSEPLHNYGPHFDASMDSGVCTTPAWLGTINPGSDRIVGHILPMLITGTCPSKPTCGAYIYVGYFPTCWWITPARC